MFTCWPWKLLGSEVLKPFIHDMNMTKQEFRRYGVRDLSVIDELYDESLCCLDEAVSEPMRAKFTVEDWRAVADGDMGADLQALLIEIQRAFRVTTMHLERRLKETKLAIPYAGGRPQAEGFCYGALLTQLWKSHIEMGGRNPLVTTRETMQQEGPEPTKLITNRIQGHAGGGGATQEFVGSKSGVPVVLVRRVRDGASRASTRIYTSRVSRDRPARRP